MIPEPTGTNNAVVLNAVIQKVIKSRYYSC